MKKEAHPCPHPSHQMKESRTVAAPKRAVVRTTLFPKGPNIAYSAEIPAKELLRLNNSCVNCGARMWGVRGDWNYDTALARPCKAPVNSGGA